MTLRENRESLGADETCGGETREIEPGRQSPAAIVARAPAQLVASGGLFAVESHKTTFFVLVILRTPKDSGCSSLYHATMLKPSLLAPNAFRTVLSLNAVDARGHAVVFVPGYPRLQLVRLTNVGVGVLVRVFVGVGVGVLVGPTCVLLGVGVAVRVGV